MQQITMSERVLLKGVVQEAAPCAESASEKTLLYALGAIFFVPPALLVTLVYIVLS